MQGFILFKVVLTRMPDAGVDSIQSRFNSDAGWRVDFLRSLLRLGMPEAGPLSSKMLIAL